MTKHDLNLIHEYWRKYNEENEPEEDNSSGSLSFGIRDDYLDILRNHGYKTNEEVLEAGEEKILEIEGIGPSTVRKIFSFETEG